MTGSLGLATRTGLEISLGTILANLAQGGGVPALLAASLFGMRSSDDTNPGPVLAADNAFIGSPLDYMHLFYETGASATTWEENLVICQNYLAAYTAANPTTNRWEHGFPGSSNSEPMATPLNDRQITIIKQMLSMIAAADKGPRILLRLMWEPTYSRQYYSTYQWSASSYAGGNLDYIARFRQIALMARAIDPRFAFVWCGSPTAKDYNGNPFDPSTCYPGDDVVDVIGMDNYWAQTGDFTTTINGAYAFYIRRTNQFALDWYRDFAIAHNKLFALPEFGISQDQPDCFNALMEYYRDQPTTHMGFWNKVDSAISNFPLMGIEMQRQKGPITILTPTTFTALPGAVLNLQMEATKRILNWSIVGGADASLFSITKLGVLSCPAGVLSRTMLVTVRATDERGQTKDVTLAITGTAGSFLPETQFYIARCTVAPVTAAAQAIDALIVAWKAAGVWQLTDRFVASAGTEQAAMLDLFSLRQGMKKVGSPVFTPNVGFAGDGISGYYDALFTPNLWGNKMTKDTNALFVLAIDDVTGPYVAAGSNFYVQRDSVGTVGSKPSSFSGQQLGPAASFPGSAAFSRNAIGSGAGYANGAKTASFTSSSTHFLYDHLTIGARVDFTNSANNIYSTGKTGVMWAGASLTDAQVAAMDTAAKVFVAAMAAIATSYVIDTYSVKDGANNVVDGSSTVADTYAVYDGSSHVFN